MRACGTCSPRPATSSSRRTTPSWAATLYPACRRIVEHLERGTDFDIRVDSDGLVTAGTPGTQLTWMDAKFGDTVFTPRDGKPVEVNALWYHGLRMLETTLPAELRLRTRAGTTSSRTGRRRRSRLPSGTSAASCLYDVIRTQPGAGASAARQAAPAHSPSTTRARTGGSELADATIRPNQIFAVSLPNTPLSAAQQELVLACVREHLLTPYGLRSLSPRDSGYKPRCEGNAYERDGAYHQGTVWPWLIGPYVEAICASINPRRQPNRRCARFLQPLIAHLDEAGLGSVSEIFDGDPPHAPRGCIAQAWSVSELLRAWRMTRD